MPPAEPLTFQEQYDKREQDHRFEQEKHQTAIEQKKAESLERIKANRFEFMQNVGAGLGILIVVLAIIFVLWWWWFGPEPIKPPDNRPTDSQVTQLREADCHDRGGVFLPPDLLAQSEEGLCVFPPGKDEPTTIDPKEGS